MRHICDDTTEAKSKKNKSKIPNKIPKYIYNI